MKIFAAKFSRLKDEAGVRVQLASVLTLASDLRLCPRLGACPLLSEPPRPPHRLLQPRPRHQDCPSRASEDFTITEKAPTSAFTLCYSGA